MRVSEERTLRTRRTGRVNCRARRNEALRMLGLKSAAFLSLTILLAGCANLPYYLQSVRGQLDIWSRQKHIEELIENPATAERLRQKLRTVLTIREFAST